MDLEMKEEALVSIVVPTYNTPIDLFARSFRSMCEQTFRQIEIIVVDDGSEQRFRDSISQMVASDQRAFLVNSPHAGASHARNVGIAHAHGEWIAFVDADDEVDERFVSEALSFARDGIDLICGEVEPIYAGSSPVPPSISSGSEWSTGDESQIIAAADQMLGYRKNKVFSGPDFTGRGPVAKLYRADKIGDLRFNEGLEIAEDELFNYKFIRKSSGISIVNGIWYRYYQRNGSVLHSIDLPKLESSIRALFRAVEEDENVAPYHSRCAFMVLEGSVNLIGQGRSLVQVGAAIRATDLFHSYKRRYYRTFELNARQRIFFLLCSIRCYYIGAAWLWLTQKIKAALPGKEGSLI